MIGYYIHHVGRGHLHRALAVAAAWSDRTDEPMAGLSTLPRPDAWPGPWVNLTPDDVATHPVDVTAGGQLHWAPARDDGLMRRTAALSEWIVRTRPRAVVVDVSVEVTLLTRLHGVPVVGVVLPGERVDAVHLAGFRMAAGLVGAWPPSLDLDVLVPHLPQDVAERVVPVGAISRFAPRSPRARRAGPRRAVVLQGRGGDAVTTLDGPDLERIAPDWRWTVVGGTGSWYDDLSPILLDADVVVTTAGQGSLADVAAHRRPAVVVACRRPHGEQEASVRSLATGTWPVVVADTAEEALAPRMLDRASALSGQDWADWDDGQSAKRMCDEVAAVAGDGRPVRR